MRRAKGSSGVPLDQQPFNELQNLKAAPLFDWAQKDMKGFALRLGAVYGAAALVSLSIASITFNADEQLVQMLLAANIGALGVMFALTLRLYAGWDYVAQRLDEDVVQYEKSGWYDGALFSKPPQVQARDQLLAMYEARPVVQRLQKTLALLATMLVVTVVSYNVEVPVSPYESVSAEYLKNLPADEWKAKQAAEAASKKNKPVYCDARYYRALAGASGCD